MIATGKRSKPEVMMTFALKDHVIVPIFGGASPHEQTGVKVIVSGTKNIDDLFDAVSIACSDALNE